MLRRDAQLRVTPRIRVAVAAVAAVALALAAAAPVATAADFALTVNVEGEGEVECKVGSGAAEPCEAEYPGQTKLTLVPVAAEGSKFAGFSAGAGSAAICNGVKTACSFTLEADSSVTASFEPVPEYSLAVNLTGSGEGEVECFVGGELEVCEQKFPEKTKIQLKPIAVVESSKFAGFSAGIGSATVCNGLLTSCTITIEADSSVTATFNLREFSLTVVKEGTGFGTVECEREEGPEPCVPKYPYGSYVYLRAEASPGSKFVGWSGECQVIGAAECEVEMEKSRKVTAKFEATEYTLGVERLGSGSGTVSSSPGGIDCGSVCSAGFPAGDVVALAAVPATGSEFAGWTGGCSGLGACEVTLSEAKKVKAYFTATPSAQTPSPPPSPPPVQAAGTARAARVAAVSGRTAMLRLSCYGGPCEGALELTAKLKMGGKRQTLFVGKASFDLAAGASKALGVRIGRRIARLLRGREYLMATLLGSGVSSRSVKLVGQASRNNEKATA